MKTAKAIVLVLLLGAATLMLAQNTTPPANNTTPPVDNATPPGSDSTAPEQPSGDEVLMICAIATQGTQETLICQTPPPENDDGASSPQDENIPSYEDDSTPSLNSASAGSHSGANSPPQPSNQAQCQSGNMTARKAQGGDNRVKASPPAE